MRSSAVPPSSKGSAAVDAQMRELSSSLSSMRVSATSRAQPADEGGDCDSKQEQSTGYALDTEGLSAVKCVYIMRGLPGSGKSTMARAIQGWCQAHGASDALILSTDDFHTRSDGTYAWKKELAGQAHQWNQDRFKRALLTRSDVVIVDNTNITLAEAYPYVHLAVQYGYAVKIRAPRTPWSSDPVQLAARNTHAVPLETIRRRLALMKKVRVYTVERILQSVREQRPGARNTEAPKKPTPSTLQPEQKKETHNSSSAPRKKHTPHGSSSRGNRQVWSEGLSRFGDPSAEDMDAFTARFRLEGLGDDQQLPDFKTLMNLFMVERTMGFLAERYAHSQPLRGGLYLRMAPIARDRSFFFGQHFTYPAYTQTMNPEVSTDSSCSMQQPLRAHASASLRRTHFDNTTGDWVVDYKSIDAFELHKLRSLARFAVDLNDTKGLGVSHLTNMYTLYKAAFAPPRTSPSPTGGGLDDSKLFYRERNSKNTASLFHVMALQHMFGSNFGPLLRTPQLGGYANMKKVDLEAVERLCARTCGWFADLPSRLSAHPVTLLDCVGEWMRVTEDLFRMLKHRARVPPRDFGALCNMQINYKSNSDHARQLWVFVKAVRNCSSHQIRINYSLALMLVMLELPVLAGTASGAERDAGLAREVQRIQKYLREFFEWHFPLHDLAFSGNCRMLALIRDALALM